MSADALSEINNFLGCPTPDAWTTKALLHLDILLIDHANCEKKAAATALNMIFRYADRESLLSVMSQLAREELLHFEQVCELMKKRGVAYKHVPSARYASGLRDLVAKTEPQKLVDTLIVGAFIEARSCERFAALANVMEQSSEDYSDLSRYYRFLLKSESRHFQDYLALARQYSTEGDDDFSLRLSVFREKEAALVSTPDADFMFHSGVPE